MKKKPKVYVLPGAFDDRHGYCAKLIDLSDYEDLEFVRDQEHIAHVALRTVVKKQTNASEIIAQAHDLAVKLGFVQ